MVDIGGQICPSVPLTWTSTTVLLVSYDAQFTKISISHSLVKGYGIPLFFTEGNSILCAEVNLLEASVLFF